MVKIGFFRPTFRLVYIAFQQQVQILSSRSPPWPCDITIQLTLPARLLEGRIFETRNPPTLGLFFDSHAKFTHSEDRDKAFELLEAYIERESDAGERKDFDRIRGLVPHMRKRLWKASSKEQVEHPPHLAHAFYTSQSVSAPHTSLGLSSFTEGSRLARESAQT